MAWIVVVVGGDVQLYEGKAAAPAPAAAPLDDNSVAALLTLDRAMETLASLALHRPW